MSIEWKCTNILPSHEQRAIRGAGLQKARPVHLGAPSSDSTCLKRRAGSLDACGGTKRATDVTRGRVRLDSLWGIVGNDRVANRPQRGLVGPWYEMWWASCSHGTRQTRAQPWDWPGAGARERSSHLNRVSEHAFILFSNHHQLQVLLQWG